MVSSISKSIAPSLSQSSPSVSIRSYCRYRAENQTAKVCALVDPGGSLEKILEMVQSRGLTLEKILLTHGHYDHVGQVSALLEVYPMAPSLSQSSPSVSIRSYCRYRAENPVTRRT